jgi:hypothetical protein
MDEDLARAGKRVPMGILSVAGLLACLALVPFDAFACRTNPPRTAPSYRDLANTSELIAVIHVERIRPLSPAEESFIEKVFTDPPMNVAIRLPTASAEFSTVRVLKGKRPEQSLIQSGVTSCDISFQQGKDYLVFSQRPASSGEIVPLYGTFTIDLSQHSLAALAEVESFLSHNNPAKP